MRKYGAAAVTAQVMSHVRSTLLCRVEVGEETVKYGCEEAGVVCRDVRDANRTVAGGAHKAVNHVCVGSRCCGGAASTVHAVRKAPGRNCYNACAITR